MDHVPGLDEKAISGIGELADLVGEKSWLAWEDIVEQLPERKPSAQVDLDFTQPGRPKDGPAR